MEDTVPVLFYLCQKHNNVYELVWIGIPEGWL